MAQQDPQLRPTAHEALQRFRQLREDLPPHNLPQLLFHRDVGFFQRVGATIYDALGLSGLFTIGVVATATTLALRFRTAIFRTSVSGSAP